MNDVDMLIGISVMLTKCFGRDMGKKICLYILYTAVNMNKFTIVVQFVYEVI